MLRWLYALGAFLGALLLFQMQPMLGKRLLPWFGGTPATWTTCMFFFQGLLFGGYLLADRLVRRLGPRTQRAVALGVFGSALLFLPIGPWPHDRVPSVLSPVLQVLGLLVRHAGLPYLALATTAPLLQHWYERATGRSPYVLYAFSNAGSLVGLLSYPFVVEPLFSLSQQAWLWSSAFALFAACMLVLALSSYRAQDGAIDRTEGVVHAVRPTRAQQLQWFALACASSVMLIAVTNQLTMDVAAVPFLWVAPLGLYLVTFIVAFSNASVYRRQTVHAVWVVCTVALGIDFFRQATASLGQQVAVLLSGLCAACMYCHGELARLRPVPAQLSGFYLWIAAGGAAGALFVALLAPVFFTGFFELPIAVGAVHALTLWVLASEPDAAQKRSEMRTAWLGVGLCMPLIVATLWVQGQDRTWGGRVIEQRRGFFGVLRVTELPHELLFSHGRIRHGMQFRDPVRAQAPTMYFGRESGAGRALRLHAVVRPRRIGVVGLGAGTLATYGRAQDRMRFYEINPDVIDIARRRFTFLAHSQAAIDVVVGDGRQSLEQEASQDFDVLLLDAFASDSVPAHLLTVEAFGIYLRHLRSDGLLLLNVSNRHLDVERVVAGSAARHGLAMRLLETPPDIVQGTVRVRWALLARDQQLVDRVLDGAALTRPTAAPVIWTDSFSNLLAVLR